MPTRFVDTQVSEGGAINYVMDTLNNAVLGNYASGAATATLTTTELVNGVYNLTGGSTATLTTPTATAIVAAIENCQAGSRFTFQISNNNSGTATFAAGTGVTLVGTATAATNTGQLWTAVVTNVATPAVTMVALLKTAS